MPPTAPQRPIEHAEAALVTAILAGDFPPGSALPGERDLAAQLGVTRPTLREALQRLARDGWLDIHQGRSTVVTDFWWDGGLNVISGIVRHSQRLPAHFVPDLLRVRLDLAAGYTRAAIEQNAAQVAALLAPYTGLPDTAEAYAAFDWHIHRGLTLASGNPVYALILNGFAGFYEALAVTYFSRSEARAASRAFYADLHAAAQQGDADRAVAITQAVMQHSMSLWQTASRSIDR